MPPIAADFRPLAGKRHGAACTFLFAGGITQRKGIKYLLEAWSRIRARDGGSSSSGPLPNNPGPLASISIRSSRSDGSPTPRCPRGWPAADVFVFPSLFEGSAVVTYEALACGLPCVVTPDAGSVVRDGIEGFVVGSRDVEASLAAAWSNSAAHPSSAPDVGGGRLRAMTFDWPRYHHAIVAEVEELAHVARYEPSRTIPGSRRIWQCQTSRWQSPHLKTGLMSGAVHGRTTIRICNCRS